MLFVREKGGWKVAWAEPEGVFLWLCRWMGSWRRCWRTVRASLIKTRCWACPASWCALKPWSRNSPASNSSRWGGAGREGRDPRLVHSQSKRGNGGGSCCPFSCIPNSSRIHYHSVLLSCRGWNGAAAASPLQSQQFQLLRSAWTCSGAEIWLCHGFAHGPSGAVFHGFAWSVWLLPCLALQNTHSQSCLKSFLECHGLSLLWIWMTELGDGRGSTANNLKLQLEVSDSLGLGESSRWEKPFKMESSHSPALLRPPLTLVPKCQKGFGSFAEHLGSPEFSFPSVFLNTNLCQVFMENTLRCLRTTGLRFLPSGRSLINGRNLLLWFSLDSWGRFHEPDLKVVAVAVHSVLEHRDSEILTIWSGTGMFGFSTSNLGLDAQRYLEV